MNFSRRRCCSVPTFVGFVPDDALQDDARAWLARAERCLVDGR